MTRLFQTAIYVNATSQRLQSASRGSEPSLPIEENKRWTSGGRLFTEAARRGEALPLIFAQYADLTFWAVAREISVGDATTRYRFAHLRPLRGKRRSDLVVESTSSVLPDDFIRSYALVRTPEFLALSIDESDDASVLPEELVGLEGDTRRRMVVHRRREAALRRAKIAEALHRADGRLACEVPGCGFDFARSYGALGEGYAQVHHLRPLADYAGPEETRLEDLAIVCANCHAMIHRGGACRPLDRLIGADTG